MPNPGNMPAPGAFQPSVEQPIGMPNVPVASAEALGAGSRQLQALGQAGEHTGLRLAEIAFDAQNQVNHTRVADASNKALEAAQKLQFDKDTGFMRLKGEAAVGASEKYGEELRKGIEGIGANLGNDAQKELFGQHANQLMAQFQGQATKHEADQYLHYQLSVQDGVIATRMNDIGLRYYDAKAIDDNITTINASVYDKGKMQGMSGEWISAQQRKMTSNAVKVAIAAAITDDSFDYATAAFKKWGPQMDADDALHIRGLLRHESEGKVAMGVASNTISHLAPRMVTSDSDRAWNILTSVDPAAGKGPSMGFSPIAGDAPTSSKFGTRKDPIDGIERLHGGTDFAAPVGTPIMASAAGKVVKVEDNKSGYGKMVEIDHGNGYTTVYAHASGTNVAVGQEVAAGDPIAQVGSTGRSTGAHLHFEVRRDGKPVDPSEFLQSGGAGRQQFAGLLKEFGNDTSMAMAAKMTSTTVVNDAIRQATETGAPSNWLKFMPQEVAANVQRADAAFTVGMGAYQKPTLQDAHNQTREALGPNVSNRVLTQALTETTRQWEDIQKALKQRDDEAVAQAQQILSANGGSWASLPSALQSRIPPGQRDELMTYAGRMAKGIPVETNMATYNKWVSDPSGLAKLSDDQFNGLGMTISREDMKTLGGLRAKFQGAEPGGNGGPGDLNISAINDVLDSRLVSLKIAPNPTDKTGSDAQRVGAIRKFVVDYIAVAQKEAGKKFSDTEITQNIDKIFAKTDVISRTFGTSAGPVLGMKAGDLDRATTKELKKSFEALGIPNPTDSQILNAYFALKVYKK